jgi:hypothetical protein
MANRLIILASSRRPDTYFNIIAHNALQGVDDFVIAAIGDSPGETATQRVIVLNRDITGFVDGLTKSHYTTFGAPRTEKPLDSPQEMENLLERISWGRLQFSYVAITDDNLENFLKDNLNAGVSFDVTACKNTALAPTVAWIVSRGGSPIQTFDIMKELTFAEQDLLPYLGTGDYRYADLSKSSLIRDATRRVNAGTISRRTFWVISFVAASIVAAVTFFAPSNLSTPILAAAATFATVMSGVSLIVRNPN